MKLRFKAYSMKNRDSNYVYHAGRLKGYPKGDPMLVFGRNIQESEYNLNIIREAFLMSDKHIMSQNRRGSFTIEVME